MKEISLWCEKYRPQSLAEMGLDKDVRSVLESCIAKKEIPNLLLAGAPGTGKTTVARILIKELDAEALVLNASDERGIDVVRDKVKRFVMVDSFSCTKIILFDEADAMTPPAQFSLRNLMEEYVLNNRFIFSANYLVKIIEPIRSRCQLLEFKPLTSKEQYSLLVDILGKENIKYNEDDVLRLVGDCGGDLRRMINEAQKMSMKGELVYTGFVSFVDIKAIWGLVKEKNWNKLRALISDKSIDVVELYHKMFDFVFNEVSQDLAVSIVGEYAYRNEIIVDKEMNFLCMCVELSKYL